MKQFFKRSGAFKTDESELFREQNKVGQRERLSPAGALVSRPLSFSPAPARRLYYKGAARRDEAERYIFICQKPSTVSR